MDGASYDARFDALARQGRYLHGEADLVASFAPRTVLDAGCGTGRVALELARRGIDVVGVDVDTSMLEQARSKAPALRWVAADLADDDAVPRGPFDVVVMAGNVVLFTAPGTEDAVVRNAAARVAPGGVLVSGFSLQPGDYGLAAYDAACEAAGLTPAHRWSTWERDRWSPGADYAVSVHRRPG